MSFEVRVVSDVGPFPIGEDQSSDVTIISSLLEAGITVYGEREGPAPQSWNSYDDFGRGNIYRVSRVMKLSMYEVPRYSAHRIKFCTSGGALISLKHQPMILDYVYTNDLILKRNVDRTSHAAYDEYYGMMVDSKEEILLNKKIQWELLQIDIVTPAVSSTGRAISPLMRIILLHLLDHSGSAFYSSNRASLDDCRTCLRRMINKSLLHLGDSITYLAVAGKCLYLDSQLHGLIDNIVFLDRVPFTRMVDPRTSEVMLPILLGMVHHSSDIRVENVYGCEHTTHGSGAISMSSAVLDFARTRAADGYADFFTKYVMPRFKLRHNGTLHRAGTIIGTVSSVTWRLFAAIGTTFYKSMAAEMTPVSSPTASGEVVMDPESGRQTTSAEDLPQSLINTR